MSKIQTKLSDNFQKLLKKQHPNFDKKTFKWNLGKIDQKMQKERYTPLYHADAGIKNGKLMGQKEFKDHWNQVFEKNSKTIVDFKFTEEEKKNAMNFDFMCFQTISQYVDSNVAKYKQLMNKMFSKSFLDEQKKLKKTMKALHQEMIDIFFVQEASPILIKQIQSLPEFKIYKSKAQEEIIVIRKENFTKFYDLNLCQSQLFKKLGLLDQPNWNTDIVIAFVDKFLLISSHLSSKKDKNPNQVCQTIELVNTLRQLYPMLEIIVGIDANSFIPRTLKTALDKKLPPQMQLYPDNQNLYTTSKERTFLQPQANKAEEIAQICRDHLIYVPSKMSTEKVVMVKSKVCTIKNQLVSEVLNLPCEEHPYDHYVVKAELTFTRSKYEI